MVEEKTNLRFVLDTRGDGRADVLSEGLVGALAAGHAGHLAGNVILKIHQFEQWQMIEEQN